MNLHAIGDDAIPCRVEIEFQQDPLFAGADQAKRRSFFDQLGDALDAPLRFAAQHEVAQAADDLAGADRLIGGSVERGLDRARVGIGAAGQQTARALHIVADGRQRLIELVRQRRGHFAHRAQARDMGELFLQTLHARLGALLLGEVADEAGEIASLAPMRLADRKMHRKGRTVGASTRDDAANADDARLAFGAVALEVAVVATAIGLGHQDPHVLADRFVLRKAEHPLGGAAEQLHDSGFVDDHHRVGHRFENRPKMLVAAAKRVLGALLRVDVEHDAGQAPRRTDADDDGAQAQPVRVTVAPDAELDVKDVPGGGAASQRLRHGGAILRLGQGRQGLDPRRKRRIEAEKATRRLRPRDRAGRKSDHDSPKAGLVGGRRGRLRQRLEQGLGRFAALHRHPQFSQRARRPSRQSVAERRFRGTRGRCKGGLRACGAA